MLQIVPFVRKAMDSSELMANLIRETPRELMYSAAVDVTKEMASFIKSNVPKLSVTSVISTLTPSFNIPFVSKTNYDHTLAIEPSNEWSIREVPVTTPTKTVTMVDRSSSTDDLPASFIETFTTTVANTSNRSSMPLLAPGSTGHEIAAVFIKSFLKIFLKVALTFILEVVVLSLRLLSQ